MAAKKVNEINANQPSTNVQSLVPQLVPLAVPVYEMPTEQAISPDALHGYVRIRLAQALQRDSVDVSNLVKLYSMTEPKPETDDAAPAAIIPQGWQLSPLPIAAAKPLEENDV